MHKRTRPECAFHLSNFGSGDLMYASFSWQVSKSIAQQQAVGNVTVIWRLQAAAFAGRLMLYM